MLFYQPPQKIFQGVIMGLLSALFFALMALFARLSRNDATSFQLLFFRALSSILILGVICRKELPKLIQPGAHLIWLRSFFGAISVMCLYWNLQHASTSVSIVLSDLAPIFIVILGYLFLKTQITFIACFGVFLAIFGIILLGLPKSSDFSREVILIGSIGAVAGAGAYLSLKRASLKYSPVLIVFAFSVVMLIFSLKDLNTLMSAIRQVNLLFIGGLILSSLLAQLLMTQSYVVLSAHAASCLNVTAGLWALLFDIFVFSVHLTGLMLIAFILIIVGVILAQHTKSMQQEGFSQD